MSDLARVMGERIGIEPTAQGVVALARDHLGCDYAGITIAGGRGLVRSLAVTDPVVEKADLLQAELGEGPGVGTACGLGAEVADIAVDGRWPSWGPAAATLGLRSLITAGIAPAGDRVGDRVGVLSLYSTRRRRFTAEDEQLIRAMAEQAALGLGNAHRVEGLKLAIEARALVGQAQGILMERFALTPEQAFDVLRRYSNDMNVKLRVVAAQLIRTGSLPAAETDNLTRPRFQPALAGYGPAADASDTQASTEPQTPAASEPMDRR